MIVGEVLSSSDRIVSQDPIDKIFQKLLLGDHVLKGHGEGPVLGDDAAQVAT